MVSIAQSVGREGGRLEAGRQATSQQNSFKAFDKNDCARVVSHASELHSKASQRQPTTETPSDGPLPYPNLPPLDHQNPSFRVFSFYFHSFFVFSFSVQQRLRCAESTLFQSQRSHLIKLKTVLCAVMVVALPPVSFLPSFFFTPQTSK